MEHLIAAFGTPLPLIDDFLLQYNVGQALLVAFVFTVLGGLALGGKRVFALLLGVFGLVFLMTPTQVAPVHYRFLGIALIVVAPVLYVSLGR